MFSFLSGANRKTVAVVDIGTSSVGIAFVRNNTVGPSEVLAAHRIFLNGGNGKQITTYTIESAIGAVGPIVKEMRAKVAPGEAIEPSVVYVVVRSPWSHSETKKLVERLPEDVRITASMLRARSESAIAERSTSSRKSLLEANVMRVEINGYPTSTPLGKRGHQLATMVLSSDVDAEFKRTVAAAITSLYPGARQEWRSHTRAILAFLRDHPENVKDVLIADVATENTDFISIRDGVISQKITIPIGTHAILERVAPQGMPEETLSLIRMLERDQCSATTCQSLKESMGRAEIELVRDFAKPLGEIAAQGRLPTNIMLFSMPDMAPWLSRFFSRIDFSQFTLTAQPFTVGIVNGQSLARWVSSPGGTTLDTSLTLASALVHIEHISRK